VETGITWYWPDKGIDTGPILVQKRVPIAENDTVGSVYFNTLFPMGVGAMVEAVELIKSGDAPAFLQDEGKATYEPPCRDEHAKIDFAKPAREVFNLIRGCDPQPGAFASVGDKRMRLYEAGFEASRSDSESAPGTIVALASDGMKVALAGGTTTVKRVRIDPNGKKVAPAELAAAGEIRLGAKLT
jgi:methionyl-tRNA formyltransferase